MISFNFNEKYLSQIPALQVLVGLGYEYLSPQAALRERGGRVANVVLEGVLRRQLAKLKTSWMPGIRSGQKRICRRCSTSAGGISTRTVGADPRLNCGG